MNAQEATALTYNQHITNQVNARVSEQEKLFRYYIGDRNSVIEYLQKVQEITFNVDDISEMQKSFLNITKKIINQLAIVYKEPAKREIIIDDEINDEITDSYNLILPRNINTLDKMAHRYAKLFNTSLTRIYFEDGKIKYDIKSSHLFDIKVSDDSPYKMIELSYPRYYKNEKGEDELYKVYWTDTEHYRKRLVTVGSLENVSLDKIAVGNNVQKTNPYGVIPYAVCRLEMQGDFWGCGMLDAANTNEQTNFLSSDLINAIIMQAWGTLVFDNTGLSEKGSKDGSNNFIKKVQSGPKHPIAFENKNGDGVKGSVYTVNGSPLIADVMNVIDWMIYKLAVMKGLNPNSMISDPKATSGFSKIIDALEQLEIRQDDIEPCREYEDERFNITRKVLNYHIKTNEIKDGIELSEDAFLQVTFADITIPKTTDEQQKEDSFELENNIINILDVARRKYPDLEDDEIIEKLKSNQELNDLYWNKPEAVKPIEKVIEKKEEVETE